MIVNDHRKLLESASRRSFGPAFCLPPPDHLMSHHSKYLEVNADLRKDHFDRGKKDYRSFGSFVGLHLFCRQAHRPYLPWNSTGVLIGNTHQYLVAMRNIINILIGNTKWVSYGCEKYYVPGSKSGITFNLSRTLQKMACLSWLSSIISLDNHWLMTNE